jgi:hypothetical protein
MFKVKHRVESRCHLPMQSLFEVRELCVPSADVLQQIGISATFMSAPDTFDSGLTHIQLGLSVPFSSLKSLNLSHETARMFVMLGFSLPALG